MITITPKRIRKDFYTTLQQMEADRRLYVRDPLRDFTREGTFSFRRTMLFLTQMESHSTNREISDFFLPLGKPVTQSAFVIAGNQEYRPKAEYPDLLACCTLLSFAAILAVKCSRTTRILDFYSSVFRSFGCWLNGIGTVPD